MIVTASRRTDIPAFYFDWFLSRLRAGYVLIPNPRNPGRLSRVTLAPGHVDCIAFWTKNPIPMLDRLESLDRMGYRYFVQFTLTPYGRTVERNLPPKGELIRAFVELSRRTSPLRTVWRYDPVLVDEAHSVEWHIERFSEMCGRLGACTERCIVSFVDPYKKIGDRFRAMTEGEMVAVASGFSEIARQYGIALFTCGEEVDLAPYGVEHGSCIDRDQIERIVGSPITAKRDANQRAACRCIESVDIGAYDTCPHGCTYCYATSSRQNALRRMAAHDPEAPMLTGYPRGDEIVTDRTAPSQKDDQRRIFEPADLV